MIVSSSSVICVLFDLAQNRLSFRKFVVEVDLVFCFSILHNLLIYSGNFYNMLSLYIGNRVYFKVITCPNLETNQ